MFYLRIDYKDIDSRNKMKKLNGSWDMQKKVWKFALDLKVWDEVYRMFKDRLQIPPIFNYLINQKKKQQEEFLSAKKIAEKNEDIDFSVKGLSYKGKNPLFNYQKHGIKCAEVSGEGFLIGDSCGLGKAQIVDNRLFTPNGRKRIGDIVIGDKIIGSDGKSHDVIGVYPQGIKKVYKMTFSDGYSMECSSEHLWKVFERRKGFENVLTVNELLDQNLVKEHSGIGHNKDKIYRYKTYYKDNRGGSKWQIPVVQSIQFQNNDVLPIEPYLLGMCLGDGHFICNGVSFQMEKKDSLQMFEGIKCNEKVCYKQNLRSFSVLFEKDLLKNLGLKDIRSWNKFIPDIYKYSTIQNRLKLLQGLMDTDGYCMKKNNDYFNSAEYYSVSERLVDDVAQIVQSLGGVCRKHCKKTHYKKNGVKYECRDIYSLNIKLPYPMIPFKLKRKRELYKFPQKYECARFIRNIEYVGQKECVCIAVDSIDHLYVTEHAIVTHNTIQGLGISILRKNQGLINNCLIVCPASVKYNWLDEIKKFTNESVLVIDGVKEQRQKKWLAKGYFFKIVGYETITCDLFIDKKKGQEVIDNRIAGAQSVLSSFDMLCVDEIHFLKRNTSQRSRALKLFKCKYRLGLTGTPIDGKLEEIQSIYQFLKPGLFPSKHKFLERYANLDFFGRVLGYKNIGQVREKIAPYYLRRLKTQVLKDLPPLLYKDIYVELEPKEMKEYNEIVKGKSKVITESDAMSLLIKARQFCDFPQIVGLKNPSAKYACLEELLNELIKENHQKVIIFTQYRTTMDLLLKNLKDDYKILVINGDTDTKERVQLCKRFNEDKDIDILIGTDAMSTGLNLQEADACIHYDDNYSPAIMIQRNNRCNRATSKKSAVVYRFITKDTVEQRVRAKIESKVQVNDALLDQNTDELKQIHFKALDLIDCL